VSASSGRKGRFVVARKQNAALLKPRSDLEGPTQEASEAASNNAICFRFAAAKRTEGRFFIAVVGKMPELSAFPNL